VLALKAKNRFFATAQLHMALESAPFASDAKVTISANAEPQNFGTVRNAKQEGPSKGVWSPSRVLDCASTGSSPGVVSQPLISKTTDARDAEKQIMGHSLVLVQRRNRGFTTYDPMSWSEELSKHGLLEKYPNLVNGIMHGFNLGIPSIARTYSPINHISTKLYREAYTKIISQEFQSGRYLGPYSRSEVERLIGPFRSSPLSLVPKPGKPGKFRAVHNFSHSTKSFSSINSGINAEDYPCTWGTFEVVCLSISRLPPGSQASVRDVATAYRTIPANYTQWPGLVIRLESNASDDNFAINTNNNFGLTSAGGVYGLVADAGADILRANGIGPLSKWVDDHIFFRIPRTHLELYNANRAQWQREIQANGGQIRNGSRLWYRGKVMPDGAHEEFDEDCSTRLRIFASEDCEYAYKDSDIDSISNGLGIVWETSKTVPFNFSIPYLGFIWDLKDRTVTIPDSKKHKYLAAVEEWEKRPTHVLLEVQKLYGKLLHATLVVPAGRAYLTSLETMLGIFRDRPFMPRTPPRHTPADLKWWKHLLQRPIISRPIPKPMPIVDFEAYSDASSGVGIAITIGEEWRAWILVPGWKSGGRDIGWAEAVGFEFLVRYLTLRTSAGTHIKVYGDNLGVVEGWWNGRSRNRQINTIFRRIHEMSHQHDCTIHTRYVPSEQNPADGPSRGIYNFSNPLLSPIPIPTELVEYVANFDDPIIRTTTWYKKWSDRKP
jgi:hypothetical protein